MYETRRVRVLESSDSDFLASFFNFQVYRVSRFGKIQTYTNIITQIYKNYEYDSLSVLRSLGPFRVLIGLSE